MEIIKPQTSKGPSDWFTGDVYPTIVLAGEEPSRVRMGSVHFAPGAHTAWHSHAVGQYLHIVEGTALVQERGGEVAILKPGDTIYTGPGVEHWHGASPDSFMVHMAIWEATDKNGPETAWGEHVTDEEANPVHGVVQYHTAIATMEGYTAAAICTPDNGDSLLIDASTMRIDCRVAHGSLLVDQNGKAIS